MHHSPAGYEGRIAHQRTAKDTFFRTSPHSPITPGDRPAFAGLSYFPVDLALRFEGLRLQPRPLGRDEVLQIATSDGAHRTARRLGRLEFSLGGSPRTLTAFGLGPADEVIFVPFVDVTSGVETYLAGRYLDIEPEPDDTYVLDFNLAYHPFCAHSPDYSCPMTPAENSLPDRIEAGERLALVGVK